MARHLGQEKTLASVRKCFWWPGVTKDVAEYCRSCEVHVHVCQRTVRKGPKVPLIPMTIMGVPFERIAMDIIRPLPKTSTGEQYVLVFTDYATRYPEAYALRNVTASAVAERLIDLFSKYGVLKEILPNQGKNFISDLLDDVHTLLGIKTI